MTIIIMMISLLATLGALVFGLFTLLTGDGSIETGNKSNKAMQWRILFQGLVLILFFLMLGFGK